MRLDKYICDASELTRKQAKQILKSGEITLNGQVVKNAATQVKEGDQVKWLDDEITLIGPRYIMLHKPMDMICSNIDEVYPSVLNLLDIEKKAELHIAGRLDADTTGLVLITNDGQWSHRITSPKHTCQKTYRVWLETAIDQTAVNQLEQGVLLHGEKQVTKPATVRVIEDKVILLTISEGKYHQVKRMLAATGNKVTYLHREQIGSVVLDAELEEGEWRYLTQDEIASF
ncbi:16S rRNA pseudouridine(516) synthase RsuA [Saccharobesus litoralis]|uniref:Pseudouridine synthase n=1 Tax=Saccharobesus litoralis TaxID=2172099 RepID=A0A2S0VU77_9ALTE|nr:16S rRNA pseudouridine(516) synthase RsuA [Saccharobesus litoralis]AWB67722.1 16S rRNA pseudouridine(516) synthase RsuA [Saccharobesus litoralis]